MQQRYTVKLGMCNGVEMTEMSLVGDARRRCNMHVQEFCSKGEGLSCGTCLAAELPATPSPLGLAVTKPVDAPRMQEPFPERSIDSLNLVDTMFHWLVHWGRQQDLRAEAAAAQRRTLLGAPDSAGRLPTGAHLPQEEVLVSCLRSSCLPCFELRSAGCEPLTIVLACRCSPAKPQEP